MELDKIYQDISEIEKEHFSDPWSREMIQDTMKYDYNHFIVCDENNDVFSDKNYLCMKDKNIANTIAGYIIYSEICGEAELLRIAISRKYQRNGKADILMKLFLNDIKRENEKALLEVRAGNIAAINLYKKYKFDGIYIRKNYYSNPKEDAIMMQYNCQ